MFKDDSWALAFSLRPWPERQKAELWAWRQSGGGIPEEIARDLDSLEQELPRIREEAEARGARLMLPGEGGLERFMGLLPYPLALWVWGSLPDARPLVAVVGSRHPSGRGRRRARLWARALTEAGVGVVSGLARGIDGEAHAGALEVGPTWGILGSGLDHLYPPEHRALMERMVAGGGGVITPFPPGAPPRSWHFPRRNLLMAAWTLGTLVLEARQRSGSLVTAKLALDLGKEVWVCPGDPEDPLAEGPNGLLREGAAHPCRSVRDLLEDLDFHLGT